MNEDTRILSISRVIPGPIILNGYSAMKFVSMMDELRKAKGFDYRLGIRVRIEQIGMSNDTHMG